MSFFSALRARLSAVTGAVETSDTKWWWVGGAVASAAMVGVAVQWGRDRGERQDVPDDAWKHTDLEGYQNIAYGLDPRAWFDRHGSMLLATMRADSPEDLREGADRMMRLATQDYDAGLRGLGEIHKENVRAIESGKRNVLRSLATDRDSELQYLAEREKYKGLK